MNKTNYPVNFLLQIEKSILPNPFLAYSWYVSLKRGYLSEDLPPNYEISVDIDL
jgi:hypothetical protein